MAFTYTFTQDPKKLGEYDEKYGQRWWCNVEEMEYPVMFNTMEREAIDLEDKIEAEEQAMKKSAKGIEYYGLKKVKIHRAHNNQSKAQTAITEPQESSQTVSKADNPQLDRIEKQLAVILEGINELKYGPAEEA
jgi:hypothetical protein